MSILIKGMEMPTSCLECRLYNDPWCMAKNRNQWRTAYNRPPKGERQNDCPLVPVPPHGDLIDREETKRRLAEHLCKMKPPIMWPDWNDAVITICTAPTIIPAEEGE